MAIRSRSGLDRALLVAWLVIAGAAWPAHAQDGADRPPFWVAGVVITAAQRSAVLVVLDDAQREVGIVKLREGESHGGYRAATVEADRVLFERNGTTVAVVVGRPHGRPTGTPAAPPRAIFIPGADKPTPDVPYTPPATRPGGERSPAASPLAPAGAAMEPDVVQDVLDRVFSNPQMQQRIERMRPVLQQKMERPRRDGEPAGDPQPSDEGPLR